MKRFSLREFLFLCAPVAVVGGGFTVLQVLHPPRDPDAVITLTLVKVSNSTDLSTPLNPKVNFGWKANAKGGPQNDIQLLYAQKLIAWGDGRSQVIYQQPASLTAPRFNISLGSVSDNAGEAQRDMGETKGVPYESLPIWTRRLEWRGDFVALPQEIGKNAPSGVGIPATFPTLARFKGAARVSKTFPVAFDAEKVAPLQVLELETVSPTNAGYGADVCVKTRLRTVQSRVSARIVAFDGKTTRQLWSNLHRTDNHYWITGETRTGSYVSSYSDFLKLRDVPAQWGELDYIVDAAFNPASASGNYNSKPVAAAEIERLKKAGWFVFSKRLTLRKKGAKLAAPNYPKTPNTKYLGTQTLISKTDWIIKVRLRYNGPPFQPGEDLDLPHGAEWLEADGSSAFSNVAISYGVDKGTTPGEYLATITVPLVALGQSRPVTMNLEVADGHAAPLYLQTKITVPKAPV